MSFSRITNLDPDVIEVLKVITGGGKLLPGALTVIGPGIPTGAHGAPKVMRVMSIDFENSSVELEQPLDSSTPAGEYRFKFW